jgi:hypothetical protein
VPVDPYIAAEEEEIRYLEKKLGLSGEHHALAPAPCVEKRPGNLARCLVENRRSS